MESAVVGWGGGVFTLTNGLGATECPEHWCAGNNGSKLWGFFKGRARLPWSLCCSKGRARLPWSLCCPMLRIMSFKGCAGVPCCRACASLSCSGKTSLSGWTSSRTMKNCKSVLLHRDYHQSKSRSKANLWKQRLVSTDIRTIFKLNVDTNKVQESFAWLYLNI